MLIRAVYSIVLLLPGAASSLLANAVPQTQPTWKLPPHSVAIYERQLSKELEEGAEKHWGPFVREINPPLLFADELTADRSALQMPVRDLRDLGSHLAFDLQTWGRQRTQRLEIGLLNSLLPMQVEVRFDAAADGSQRARGSLHSVPRTALEEEEDRYLTGGQGLMEGSLELLRRYDATRGLVTSFDFRMDLKWTPRRNSKTQGRFDLSFVEAWNLKEVLSSRAADVPRSQERIRDVIERARTAMLKRLGPPTDPSIWPAAEQASSSHGISRGAYAGLCIAALLHAGIEPDHPIIKAACERMMATPAEDITMASAHVLAWAAKYAPRSERSGLRHGSTPTLRVLPPRDFAAMRSRVDQILAGTSGRFVDGDLMWLLDDGQPSAERAHLATRALAEAAWCGIPLPPDIWTRVTAHWLTLHVDEGFLCASSESEPTGCTTACALDALGVSRHFLATTEQNAPLLRRIDSALRSGWSWMDAHYTTRAHPGPRFYGQRHRYHFSWALCSAVRNQNVRELSGRDIAWENAMHYVHALNRSDRFANPDEDAMVLLTLDAPAAPPTTPGSQR